MAEFLSIAEAAQAEIREKSSRFFAFAYPASSPEEAEKHIAHIKKEYHDSRHVCFAWRFGAKGDQMRAYDAGEPAHSAGTPILNEIRSRNLTQLVVIVVRYFGGTKLGIPGLIEAYREAASLALDNAKVVVLKTLVPIELRFPYQRTSEVRRALHKHPPESQKEMFAEDCRIFAEYTEDTIEIALETFREMGILVENSH